MTANILADACKSESGVVAPDINTLKCEGAGDCEAVCPYDVFTVRRLDAAELKALPFLTWIKVLAHGGRQAFVVNSESCHACGLCVAACPEKAIGLKRLPSLGDSR